MPPNLQRLHDQFGSFSRYSHHGILSNRTPSRGIAVLSGRRCGILVPAATALPPPPRFPDVGHACSPAGAQPGVGRVS
jgi:hypothetical protein